MRPEGVAVIVAVLITWRASAVDITAEVALEERRLQLLKGIHDDLEAILGILKVSRQEANEQAAIAEHAASLEDELGQLEAVTEAVLDPTITEPQQLQKKFDFDSKRAGFFGVRGKKFDFDEKRSDEDVLAQLAQEKRAGFFGARGKKFDFEDKRAGFFGLRGKKFDLDEKRGGKGQTGKNPVKRPGFFGLRGKKFDFDEKRNWSGESEIDSDKQDFEEKRAGFFGARGKRSA